MNKGYLIVNVYGETIANPILNANVNVSKNNQSVTSVLTDEDGKTSLITLETVSINLSEDSMSTDRPYQTYDVLVTSLGMQPQKIEGVQIFPGITSVLDVYLRSVDENQNLEINELSPNTLWENDAPQLMETTSSNEELGIAPLVLNQVVVPPTIVVHDGVPSSTSASNYTVQFTDYIKNVASSEIYPTWPEEALRANILAIISFALNRIYTEWYLNKGYNFNITSTSSYDQKYTRGGTVFSNISSLVDEIFNNYIRYGIREEPILAHYKSETSESGYLSQWGSKRLADQGYNFLDILKYYYGPNVSVASALVSNTYPYSFTSSLKEGDCSRDVYILQNTLNYIRGSYPGIPVILNPSGLFDSLTTAAVRKFQSVFGLNVTGTVDYSTWYKISYIFTAVSNLTSSIY